jgi:hypothetical protein
MTPLRQELEDKMTPEQTGTHTRPRTESFEELMKATENGEPSTGLHSRAVTACLDMALATHEGGNHVSGVPDSVILAMVRAN